MGCMKNDYEANTEDWTGILYSGSTPTWDYNTRKVHLSMPRYCMKAFTELQYDTFTSHPYVPLFYGKKFQIAK